MLDPVAVWSGELRVSGVTLHLHVLDDGMRIVEAADLHALMAAWEGGAAADEDEAAAFGRWRRGGDLDAVCEVTGIGEDEVARALAEEAGGG